MSRRDRVSNNFREEVVGRFYDNGYYQEMNDLPVMTWYRQIVDYPNEGHVGWNHLPGYRDVKPVQYLDFHATDAWWVNWIGHLDKLVIMFPAVRRPLYPTFVTGCVPLVPDDVIDEFSFQCFLDWDTQIKEDFQPFDFLSGLTEIKNLIPKLSGSLTKDVASGYLGYEFGWKNFAQDLNHLASLLSIVQGKLQALRDSWGKEQRLAKEKVLDWVQPDQQDELFYEPRPAYGWRYKLSKYRAVIHCGCYRFHKLKDLDSTLSFIRAAFTDLGLGNPLKAIWDAIPFSFVVNWFSTVGQLFDQQRVRHLFEGVWEIRHPCTSVRIDAVIACSQENLNHGVFIMPNQVYPAGEIFVKRYVRIPGISTAKIKSRILDLSPKQLLLLLALGAQKGA